MATGELGEGVIIYVLKEVQARNTVDVNIRDNLRRTVL